MSSPFFRPGYRQPVIDYGEAIQYNRCVLEDCETGFFTENGEGDLVVMDIETYNKWKTMQRLKEELLAVEEDRAAGIAGCTLDELDAYLDDMIAGEWQMAESRENICCKDYS